MELASRTGPTRASDDLSIFMEPLDASLNIGLKRLTSELQVLTWQASQLASVAPGEESRSLLAHTPASR
jgi:hypothetical protein